MANLPFVLQVIIDLAPTKRRTFHVRAGLRARAGFPDELNDFFSSPEGAPLCNSIKLCNEEQNKNKMLLTSVFYPLAFVVYFRTFVPFLIEPRSRCIYPKS